MAVYYTGRKYFVFHSVSIFINMLVLFITFCLIEYATSAKLPPEVKLCSKKDPNFFRCVEKNMHEAIEFFGPGYPELGIVQLEPFHVDKMEIAGSNVGSVQLNQKYEDVKIHGFSKGIISNMKIDLDKCRWEFDSFSSQIRMESNYELEGRLLLFPINGHGKCNVTLNDMVVKYIMDCKRVNKKDGIHMQVTDVSMKMNPKDVHFDFENVIPGNEQLSKDLSKTINENSLEVFKDVKGAFEEAYETIYKTTLNQVFAKLTESQIFLD